MHKQINNYSGQKMQYTGEQRSVCSSLSQQSTILTYPNPPPVQHASSIYTSNYDTTQTSPVPQLARLGYNSELVDDRVGDWADHMDIARHHHYAQFNGLHNNVVAQYQHQSNQTPELNYLPLLQQVQYLIGRIMAATQSTGSEPSQLMDRLKQIAIFGTQCQTLIQNIVSSAQSGKLQSMTQKPQPESIVLIYEIPIEMQFQQQKQQLKINEEILWLHQSITELTQENQQLSDRIRDMQMQLHNQQQQVINNIYQIPVEMKVAAEAEYFLEDKQDMDSEAEIIIKIVDDGKADRIKKSLEINRSQQSENEVEGRLENFSFNNCINEASHKKQCEQSQILQSHISPDFELKQWACINNIYEIPVELIMQDAENKNEGAQDGVQTSAYHRSLLLRLDSAVVEYNYFENLLSSRKKRNAVDVNSRKKHQQHQMQNESISMVTKQMQMLLQSEEIHQSAEKEQIKTDQGNGDITYKANIVTDSANLDKNQQMARSDDIERQSVLFMEFSNILNSNQMNKNLLTPSLISKQLAYNSQENTKPINEQDDENQYDNSHSMEPSLINGISMIRKRQQHSQTQSQINQYLQVYNYSPTYNQADSYESKNNGPNCTGMNNCNHCGISIKNSPKAKGFNNRSLGNNRDSQNGYLSQIENVIEERYSEESKSKRTPTIKNININVVSPSEKIEEVNDNQDDQFMVMRTPPKQMRKGLLNNKPTKAEERILQLGHSLNMQKSLVIESNMAEEAEKKKAKQRLSQHPYLNFYETSQLEQISQIKAQSRSGSQVLKDISRQEKKQPNSQEKNPNKSSFEQASILINFTSSLQPGLQSREGLKFQQIGLQDIKPNYENFGVVNLKNEKNEVYIIDGDTSSEGSRANRQMKISEMKNQKNKSIKPNNQESPQNCSKLREEAVDMTEFYELTERLLHSQQQKSILVQKLHESDIILESIRKEMITQQEQIAGMELHYKEKLSMLLEQLESYDQKLETLEKQLSQKADRIQEEVQKKAEKEKQLAKSSEQIMKNQIEIKELSENLRVVQKNYELMRAKNMKQNQEKEQLVEQLRSEITLIKQEYYCENATLREELKQREGKIEDYLKQIERSQEKIEHMKTEYHEMMNSLEVACREKDEYLAQLEQTLQSGGMFRQVSAWSKIEGIYESEFAKCRDSYAQDLQGKSRKIFQLELQNSNYNKQMKQLQQLLENLQLNLKEKDARIQDLEEQVRQRKKLEISAEIQQELNYLRKEVVSSTQQLEYKDKVIRRLEDNISDIEEKIEQFEEQQLEAVNKLGRGRRRDDANGYNFQLNLKDVPHRRSVRNLFPLNMHTTTSIINTTNMMDNAEIKEREDKISELAVTIRQYELDIDQFKRIILNYELILGNNQKIIRDLQEKVGEYLQDAMEKQRQSQALYADIESYEAEINQMLLEKIAVEIENKRMKKIISVKDKKMSAIGTRLIHATKDKPKVKDQLLSPIPVSQNSTLKIRELRIE